MSHWEKSRVLAWIIAAFACSDDRGDGEMEALQSTSFGVAVHETYPHARDAFTQGLLFRDGWLYESTGLEGSSSLRRVELATGRVDKVSSLPDDVFGEGLAAVGSHLVQLTWLSGRAFVYDLESMLPEHELSYEGEGWGLCYDGKRLVMSDGSHVLQFRDPETFERIGEVEVRRDGVPVDQLNELECVGAEVFANIWLSPLIARIDAESGQVTGMIDTDGILLRDGLGELGGIDVLNGIAYVPERDRFLITGKLWPWLFEVTFVPGPARSAGSLKSGRLSTVTPSARSASHPSLGGPAVRPRRAIKTHAISRPTVKE
jgi:glutaminyl-peptide cyclotransferase